MNRTIALRCSFDGWETPGINPALLSYAEIAAVLNEYVAHLERAHPYAMGLCGKVHVRIGGDG